jgi:ribonuclease Y
MAMEMILIIGAVAAGLACGWVLAHRKATQKMERVAAEAGAIRKQARSEAEATRTQFDETHRVEASKQRAALDREVDEAQTALTRRQLKLATWEEQLESERAKHKDERAELEERRRTADKQKAVNRKMREEVTRLKEEHKKVLQNVCGETTIQTRTRLVDGLIEQVKASCSARLRNLDGELEPEAGRHSKRILGISTSRYQPRPAGERQSSGLKVTPEEATWLTSTAAPYITELEEATTVTVSVGEPEGLIRIESPDGVARELVRRALEKLIAGRGRGNSKVKISVLVGALRKELEKEIMKAGHDAFNQMDLKPAHPKICELLGRLSYRTSYSQNQYYHAIEASVLAGLMATELRLDVNLARRAALLHDIGKALTHEVEGSHALIGAEIAKTHGESPEVVDAVASHHGDQPPETVYAHLVAAADAVSGARPGARRELVEAYVDRIQDLERVANGFPGVAQAYAVQAGRELRVVVDEKTISDRKASELAAAIAQKISEEVVFPGQVKITVIRELSVVAVAC